MRLTVLGASASYAGPGQACSGYLLEASGSRVLFDCGNGVIANLSRVCDPLMLDAVFLTHEHPDHICDIYALQALLRYAPEGPAAPLPLHLPAGLFDRIGSLLSERGRQELAEAFLVHELDSDSTVMIGALAVTPTLVEHTAATFALIADDESGRRLSFTSDARANSLTLRVAAGSDLLLAEATLPEQYKGRAPHMTASEAGTIARMAGVGKLVLTHLWPTIDPEVAIAEARGEFDGQVLVAREFDTYEL